MIRIYLIVVFIFFIPINTYCQLGINTVNPKATLDVVGHPDDPKIADGLMAPHLTLAQIHTKTYNTAQTGAMVYITNSDLDVTPLPDAYRYISAPGYYIFDGTIWNPLEAQTGDVIFAATLGADAVGTGTGIDYSGVNITNQEITGDKWDPIQLNSIITNIGGGVWTDGSADNEYHKYTYTIPVSGSYLVSAYIRFRDAQVSVTDNYINVGEITGFDADSNEGNWQTFRGTRYTSDYFRIRYYEKGQKVCLYMWIIKNIEISNAFLYIMLFNSVG